MSVDIKTTLFEKAIGVPEIGKQSCVACSVHIRGLFNILVVESAGRKMLDDQMDSGISQSFVYL